tara:strand:- start:110 stop:541 length:432 start_codon:yes stop_codon:yes gene_type:complete
MIRKNKAFVFDLDGTLFETTAKEIEGESGMARYSEFADITKLLWSSTPLSLLDLCYEVQKEGHEVYILTARNSCVWKAIAQLLQGYGVTPNYIFTVGDRGYNVPAYKAEILEQLAKDKDVYFYDDDPANLDAAPLNIRKYLQD